MQSLRQLFDVMFHPAGRSDRIAIPREEWPAEGTGPRVVIESGDSAWQWAAKGILESGGYQVACCGGPHDLPGGRCSLVVDGRCPLIDGADVVVNSLGIVDPANREILAALRLRRPELPVVAEIPTPQVSTLDAEIPGCRPLAFPTDATALVDAVDAALGTSLTL